MYELLGDRKCGCQEVQILFERVSVCGILMKGGGI
jgi:hypothetical protein